MGRPRTAIARSRRRQSGMSRFRHFVEFGALFSYSSSTLKLTFGQNLNIFRFLGNVSAHFHSFPYVKYNIVSLKRFQ